jgi:hypothetical protein
MTDEVVEMKQSAVQPRKCSKCARAMVAITLDIDAAKRTLHSCSHCDVREWEAAGDTYSLKGVLTELADSAGS